VAAAVVAGTSLKFFPIMLIIPLIVERKFKLVFLVVGVTAAIMFASTLAFEGGLPASVSGFLRDAHMASPAIGHRNYSINGLTMNLAELSGGTLDFKPWISKNPWILGIGLAIIVTAIQFDRGIIPWVRWYYLLAALTLMAPVSFVYSLTGIAAFALAYPLLVGTWSGTRVNRGTIILLLVFALSPIPLDVLTGNGGVEPWVAVSVILWPAATILCVVVLIVSRLPTYARLVFQRISSAESFKG